MEGEVKYMRGLLCVAVGTLVVVAGCGKAGEGPVLSSGYKLYEAASTSSTPIVAVIDARSKATERRLPWGTLSPNGSHFYALSSKTLQDIDPRTGVVLQGMQLPRSFDIPPATISGIRGGLSQNGRWLVLQAFDRTASGQGLSFHLRADSRRLQRRLFLPQEPPVAKFADRSVLIVEHDSFGGRRSRMRLGLCAMLLDHRLDLLSRIAAGIDQILAGLIEFIFVQFQLRLGKLQLILNFVLLIRFGLRQRGGEIIYALLIRGEQSLGLRDARLDGRRRGIEGRRMRFGIA